MALSFIQIFVSIFVANRVACIQKKSFSFFEPFFFLFVFGTKSIVYKVRLSGFSQKKINKIENGEQNIQCVCAIIKS